MTRNDPLHIAISRSRGIQIDWKDGHHSSYSLEYLREECPCASCAATHGGTTYKERQQDEVANPFQMYKPTLKMVQAEPVGSYAVRIGWSDGHNTGIYSFDHLRKICPCEECRRARAGETAAPAPSSPQVTQ